MKWAAWRAQSPSRPDKSQKNCQSWRFLGGSTEPLLIRKDPARLFDLKGTAFLSLLVMGFAAHGLSTMLVPGAHGKSIAVGR